MEGAKIVVFDEFSYLVVSDPTLPSIIQRWYDRRRNKKLLLVLSGSSTHMMQHAILDEDAPLYGRAAAILQLKSMSFSTFCSYHADSPGNSKLFELYSLTGGVPRYWELLKIYNCADAISAASELFFGLSAVLESEPRRLLSDERIEGISALSLLESIGRGASRPSEIAGRMGVAQTSLSKSLELLIRIGAIAREVPFGTSVRESKKSLYRIIDPCLRFWFSVYSPYRSRWQIMNESEKTEILRQHTGYIFEDYVREYFTGSSRYWEPGIEFDCVVPLEGKQVSIIEVKWGHKTKAEKVSLEQVLRDKFSKSNLAKRYELIQTKVIDSSWLNESRKRSNN